jgi:hypothetical protein
MYNRSDIELPYRPYRKLGMSPIEWGLIAALLAVTAVCTVIGLSQPTGAYHYHGTQCEGMAPNVVAHSERIGDLFPTCKDVRLVRHN